MSWKTVGTTVAASIAISVMTVAANFLITAQNVVASYPSLSAEHDLLVGQLPGIANDVDSVLGVVRENQRTIAANSLALIETKHRLYCVSTFPIGGNDHEKNAEARTDCITQLLGE